jgi:hypothetical protein
MDSSYNSFESIVLQVDAHFVQHSRIRPYFYDGKILSSGDPNWDQVVAMAEVLIDFFDHILTVVEHNVKDNAHWSKQFWENWIEEMFSNSPVLQERFDRTKEWYPQSLVKVFERSSKGKESLEMS